MSEHKQIRHQLMPRDHTCLRWIGMQYAIRLDHLQRLLYRSTPEEDRHKLKPGCDQISLDRTYELINKWLALGLVEKKTILHGDKLWLWLSRNGLRECQLSFNYGNGAPAASRLAHLYCINQVRLAVEAKRPHDLWQSERQLRQGSGYRREDESRPHIPDALLTNAQSGKVTAIEVEVNAKTDRELEEALRELAVSYTSVWYFTTSATRRQIETMLETFSPQMQKPFVLYNLKEFTHEYAIS